ncbi:DNA adenine methylase [Peptoniphilus stercorisuis]|uniref:Site-specific DNA-methyltransferase (adenine-specific) n=1 Tax=Peptoniphilus stercorisuis TaxID=1436965 RepID=A0ABS4K9Q2_9FIRM|nr:DNA adenine methylase [Peptoniphilus stercorisuis]MBP2024505.1 DNA adenine methylase [Peptoniphilus stercorisuis]
MSNVELKPIVKWVGGKRQSLSELEKYIPDDYNNYIEPFIGGGALFFKLQPKKAIINDINGELINLYNIIKSDVSELILDLNKHKNNKEYFYEIREIDRSIDDFNKLSNIEKASRMLYLNKTCFNGMYRVNKKNEFNVPYGNYKNPKIIDELNLYNLNKYLNKNDIKIFNKDFEDILMMAKKEDFVYLDPPYYPISDTSNFTDYSKDGFNKEDQIRLKENCDKLNKKNINFLQSNSYCDFILDLYSDYNIIEIYSKRVINSQGDKRGEVKEVLITNMEV